jgi:hypothetical protein
MWAPGPIPESSLPLERPAPAGHRRLAIVAGAVLALLLGAGGLGIALRGNGDNAPGTAQQQSGTTPPTIAPTTEATTDPPTTEATTDPPTTEATTDPQAAALDELESIYDQDRGSVSFNGQYVAQIASKYPGIVDQLQTTTNGSHRFEATDILAEYKELSSGHGTSDHPVVLLKSTDYGKRQLKDGHFLWVTFALGDFPSAQSVHNWCDSQFSDLSATERANQCVPRRLQPGD